MNNLLQILIGLVIVALITLLTAPYFIDWNGYKSEIEFQASKLLGRQLRVAGDVNLRLLPAPYLQLEDITVRTNREQKDTPSATPALLKAKKFRLWLSAPPLLRGVIEVQEIEIIQPRLRFAIDENGQSNWSGNNDISATLPFTPTAISLQSMSIHDGQVEISTRVAGKNGTVNRALVLNALNGDFSAGSLKGPYKFNGTIGEGTGKKVLRISTGSIDDKSRMRVKGVLRSPKGGQRYAFDGSVIDLKNSPTLNGVISAAFPFFRSVTTPARDGKASAPVLNRAKPVEVKTSINANSHGALFDKILVTIVHKNRPQALTGKGRLSWDHGQIDLDGSLNARLIDIDQLKDGLKVGNTVAETVSNLFAGLRHEAARVDSGRFYINIDQIKLNGDLVQDLKIDLEQSTAGLQVKKLFARLPGNNIIKIDGRFDGQEKNVPFTGRGLVRGQSLGHLVNWAAGTKVEGGVSAIRSHPFTLRGKLTSGKGQWALDQVIGDIAGTSFTGAISYDAAKKTPRNEATGTARGLVNISLTTSEIDSAALVGRPVIIGDIIRRLRATGAEKSPATDQKEEKKLFGFADLMANNALKLQLHAGRVRFEDFDGRDLVADIYYGLHRLQITRLSVQSQKGLRLEADGSIVNLEKSPGGTLAATVNIEDKDELGQVLSWFRDAKSAPLSPRQISSLTPLRLALMLQTGSDKGTEARIRVNGITGSSHISLRNRILGEHLFSRNARRSIRQLELTGTIDNEDGRLLLIQLVPYLPIDLAHFREIGHGKLWFSVAGLPEMGLNSRLEFNSKRVTASLNGLWGGKQNEGGFTGSTRLQTTDAASGLALIGIDAHDNNINGSLDLSATLDKRNGRYELTGISGKVADSDIEGRAVLTANSGGKKLDLVLLTSRLHLPALFSPLLERTTATGAVRNAGPEDTALQLASRLEKEVGPVEAKNRPVFTGRHFTSDLLQGVKAKILLTADKLYLADNIMVENGEVSVDIDKRRITVSHIDGRLWGGRLRGTGNLDLSAPLAVVRGKLNISDFSLEKLPLIIDDSPLLGGKASVFAQYSGRGISPAGLFALMNGKGELKISEGKINRFSSSVLTDIVDDQLGVWKQSEDQSSFKERFMRHLAHADFALPSFAGKFTIKDGTLSLRSTIESDKNSLLDIDASLTLASMITHTRLSIAPTKGAKYENIPAAGIICEGSLARLERITPKVDTASLEQYLTVLKMEHDVKLLEKLHKRDEEFARRAAERRALLEQQRKERESQNQPLGLAGGNANSSGIKKAAPAPENPASWSPFGSSIGGSQ